jgi:iron complex transport system substrate-binding protein
MFKINGMCLKGESWASLLKDAQANYLWKDTKGTGSVSLPFESF